MLRIIFLCLLVSVLNAQQVVEDVLCEGRVFEPKCATGNIRIIAASFGVTDAGFCGGNQAQWGVNCAVDVADTVRSMCGGKPTCSVPVEGRNPCAGSVKFLQIVWGCDSGIPQNRVNNKGVNIMVSNSPAYTSPLPLHGQTIRGSNLYVFLSPFDQVLEARWFIDQTDLVVTTADQSPFDLYPGRPWDTTTLPDGVHRVMVILAFNDQSTGSVDATVMIKNGVPVASAATEKPSEAYLESATVTEGEPSIPAAIPWSLFVVAAVVAVILVVVIILKIKNPARA